MIAIEILDKLYLTWGNDYRHKDIRTRIIKTLEKGTPEDKAECINSLFGIFDGTVKGNIFTYYYWVSKQATDNLYNYSGKTRARVWRSTLNCRKVKYNYRTGTVSILPVRFNAKCTENHGRIL